MLVPNIFSFNMQSNYTNYNVHINPVFRYYAQKSNYISDIPSLCFVSKMQPLEVTPKLTRSSNELQPVQDFSNDVPYEPFFSKGWFFHNSCDVECTQNRPFQLRSCCFINEKYLPSNTINLRKFRQTALEFYKRKTANKTSNNLLVSVSKHKLVRRLIANSVESPKCKISPLILCTKRKLIRKTKPSQVPIMALKKFIVKKHSLVRINKETGEAVYRRKHPVLVLTQRKLIRRNPGDNKLRKINNISLIKHDSTQPPEKLIALNRNKLVRSSLLLKTQRSSSLLNQMIKNRRKPNPGGGYVLLTRNKLIKREKNRTWQTKKFSKMFVSLGKNKLIRKSLFKKTNNENKMNSVLSPVKHKILTRMLNSPSRRIQTFTNHLARRSLRYLGGAEMSRYRIRNRFTNKHKNNKKVLRKKKNTICPVFQRRGTCSKHLRGECAFIHDKKYIALCRNFINGNCKEDDCFLSHDLIPNKISVCQRFICDNCSNVNCSYLHVKPSSEAPICAQFLSGYCDNGEKCVNWHVHACPEFKSTSKCRKSDKCRLPHRDLAYFEGKFSVTDDEEGNNWRYFEKNKLDDKMDTSISIIPERLTLGELPDYIPI